MAMGWKLRSTGIVHHWKLPSQEWMDRLVEIHDELLHAEACGYEDEVARLADEIQAMPGFPRDAQPGDHFEVSVERKRIVTLN